MQNKLFILIVLVAFLSIVGCATVTPKQQAKMNEEVPVCFHEKDCELKWTAARRWVLNNISRKIQIYSDDLIETYNPAPNSPLLAARVVKEATTHGGYAITARVWCNNMFGCHPKKVDAIASFNNYVNPVIVKDKTIYESFLRKNNYSKPTVGVYLVEINRKLFAKSVYYGSPAMKAGIKPQDIIVQWKGHNISTMQDLKSSAGKLNFGDEIELKVNRNGNIIPLTLNFPSEEEIQKIRSSDNTDTVKAPQNNIEEKIESLSRLLKKGLITQEESVMSG